MKILVTGGAGFIGSNVVDAYIEAGHEVIVVDNLSSGKKENINPKARFIECDIRSHEMRDILNGQSPDVINHHAAQISVPASVEDPLFDADVNISGFLNVMEGVRAEGKGKVIFISSGGAIYGEAAEYPTSENYQPVPLSPYAVAKEVAEKYLRYYHHQFGIDYTVLRYANVYGPRQIPHGEAGVVAIFMDRLLAGKACTINHFEDEARGMLRDYCYVGDVARANLAALSGGSLEACNIGTGTPTHTLDLFNSVYEALKEARPDTDGTLASPAAGAARLGDIRQSCLVVNKAKVVLGWEPQVDIKEGIRKTLEWRLSK
ncbi:UDP-glucose 4-epimerase [hydrothermal vent metagenome]|uniref:UDP-glucose 4-epimerase n=1 Tax=hydrothermal vent metagenome TaxID=652676 RepID=A0A3B0VMB1_9ZZZZ